MEQFFKLPGLVKLTNTEPFAGWFVVTGDATADGIRVVRSVLGAISSLPIVALPSWLCHAGLLISKHSLVSRVAEWSEREAVLS